MSEPTSRRSVLTAAAWSTPVILVATAAPAAAAASTTPALTPNLGATSVQAVPFNNGADLFYDVILAGATITPTGAGIAAGALSLVVTFVKDPNAAADGLYPDSPIPGWGSPPVPTGSAPQSLTYTYPGAVAAGTALAIPDGDHFGANYGVADEYGTFVMTFIASGFPNAVLTLATPTPPPTPAGQGTSASSAGRPTSKLSR